MLCLDGCANLNPKRIRMRYRAIKLLMTTDTLGGVWHYSLALCDALAQWGVEIVLATMGDPLSSPQREAVSKLSNVVLAESTYRLEWMLNSEQDVVDSGRWLLTLAQDADLVHINGYAHAALPFEAPVILVAHSDVLSWYAAVRGEAAPAVWNGYADRVSAGLSLASAIVAPTCATLGDLARHFGSWNCPGCVISNGIALDRIEPNAKRPVIISVGRLWDDAKNFDLLDRVAPSLAWPIEIAGDPRHPEGGGKDCENLRLLG